ncbi:MAG: DUF5658 family protein [Methanospirillum sp.]|uniref:DUF5658 family protein n=1 Tax=Methanospirillum sp. TaxID=45200 RepID=UPI002371E3D3|nr:DUF5658 family protein [Methanospirillum sp.]MDD1729613.1 DUF5658 family protein [Methanospirillum sp.]
MTGTKVWHYSRGLKPSYGSSGTSWWMMTIVALFCLQSLDLLTTKLVIEYGGVELNPVFSIFQQTIWFWPIMSAAKVLLLFWVYVSLTTSDRYYPLAAWATGMILILQSAIVVGNNIMVLLMIS